MTHHRHSDASLNAGFGMIQAPLGAQKGKLFLERATRSYAHEHNRKKRLFSWHTKLFWWGSCINLDDSHHEFTTSDVISHRHRLAWTGKDRRSAGHRDFIDKHTKLFTAQYAVSLTLKMLNKITGGLQNAVLRWNLKCGFNFPISLPPQISIPSAISARVSQKNPRPSVSEESGVCVVYRTIFQKKSLALNFDQISEWKRVRGVKKKYAPRGLALERPDLTHTQAAPLNRKKPGQYIHTSKWPKQAALSAPAEKAAATDFIASQLMCRVSTRYRLPTKPVRSSRCRVWSAQQRDGCGRHGSAGKLDESQLPLWVGEGQIHRHCCTLAKGNLVKSIQTNVVTLERKCREAGGGFGCEADVIFVKWITSNHNRSHMNFHPRFRLV